MAHMPLAPRSLLGLANLRGAVLPVVSLRRLLGLPDAPPDDAARIVVIAGHAAVGLAVDRVDAFIEIAADQLADDRAGAGRLDPDILDGVVKGAEGADTIKIIDPTPMLQRAFERIGARVEAEAIATSARRSMRCRSIVCARSCSFPARSPKSRVRKPPCSAS